MKPHSQRLGRDVQFSYRELVVLIGRVREDAHTADLGNGLLEQFQLFGDDFQTGTAGHPCDIPARPREARDEPGANGIANANHDDRDGLGGMPAAVTPCVPADSMMSTLSRTSSAGISGSRSSIPSANR